MTKCKIAIGLGSFRLGFTLVGFRFAVQAANLENKPF